MSGNIIFIYGPMAVGKFTVAKILSERLGYKFSHNHLINDLAWSIYERDTLEGNRFIEELRLRFFDEAARSGVNLVTTHAYAHNFVSMTGLSDPEYMKDLEVIFEKNNTNFHFIHLKATNKKLLDRVTDTSRKDFKKLTDKSIMTEILNTKDFNTSAPVKNNIVINNSDQMAEETVDEILKRLNLDK